MYVTNPIFIILGPIWLASVTLGALKPRIVHEDVRFVNPDCSPFSPELHVLAQINQELFRALHPHGDDFGSLSGKLFQMDTSDVSSWGIPHYHEVRRLPTLLRLS